MSLMYLAQDLHRRTHGSVGMNEITHRKFILDILQIPNNEISPKLANSIGFQNMNNIHVIYSHNHHITRLDKALPGGLSRFHHDLTQQLLKGNKTDVSQHLGKVVNGMDSRNICLTFGFGRIQRKAIDTETWKVKQWTMNDQQMPTIQHMAFTNLPDSLKPQMMKLFESAQLFVDNCIPNAFPITARTHQCSKKLNAVFDFPKPQIQI